MQKAISKMLVSVMLVLVMVLAAVQPIISTVGSASIEVAVTENAAESSVNAGSVDGSASSYIAKKNLYTKVIVATTNVAELADYLSVYDYDGIIGSGASNRNGIAFPVLGVPPSAIPGIASLRSVMGVYDYVDPVSSISTDGTTFSRSLLGLEPNSAVLDALNIESGTLYHGAEDAWNNGYTGAGVKIATITAGTDFSNVELIGRQAVITDPSSPYYNYPIAFDPNSMSLYISEGLQSSTLSPSDSWYVNTSSTDLDIFHTIVVDGVNDFWDELSVHDLPEGVYALDQTSDKKAKDPAEDMETLEFDLTSLFIASDKENWYMGFDVSVETKTWNRSLDANYGIYISKDDVNVNGPTSDPLGKKIATAANLKPEFAIYFNHIGVDWGVDTNGEVWTNNNTVQNATFYTWVSDSWKSMDLMGELPFNLTNGITPAAGSTIFTNATGRYVRHNNENYRMSGSNQIFFGSKNVTIEIITCTQAFAGDFVELSVPKKVIPGVESFHTILFSTGANASHAQDTVPSDNAVAFKKAEWNNTVTTLSEFRFINAPPKYVVDGVPSKSGVRKIGLHPDQNLMNQHYGRPVAVLVTDYYTSGVYDTVYVDLDNDKSFANERPIQRYGAYNDSLMIGPNWGTQRFANNSVLHNNTWYEMKNNSLVTKTATDRFTGPGNTFILGNASVMEDTLDIERWPLKHKFDAKFENASVVYTVDDSEVTPWSFSLPLPAGKNAKITNQTYIICHYFDGTDHYYEDLLGVLDPSVEVNVNTGVVTFTDSGWDNPLSGWGVDSMDFYAWYEYEYEEPVNPAYAFNSTTSTITLTQALYANDYLNVTYSYKKLESRNLTQVDRFGTIIYKGNEVHLELRDWVANKDLDAMELGAGDGMEYPDVSGGMVYFIADGVNPVPYMDVYWEWNSVKNESRKIPSNGDMVAFFGEFAEASTQGTAIASAICAGGEMMDGHKEEIDGKKELRPNALVKGMAPDASLISIRGGAFASWYFAVEGYDGIVGTADDAQIVAITSNFPVSTSGWDVYTKGAEYIGKYYAKGNVTFVAATGDNGFGYGTALSPGSSEATITSAQGTMFDYRCYNPGAPTALARVYADGGTNPHHGDVLPSAGRGPNMLGNPEPDVVTAGAFLFGSIPLNVDQDYTTPTEFDWFGGQWAWDLWSGSAASAASTAGILALIYDAFHQVNGRYPNNLESRSLIRSGADNMNYDSLVQGAGWTNAERSTNLAANLDGLYLDKSFWVPGDYRGVRYEGFVKLMEPGETATQAITVTNKNPNDSKTVQLNDAIFHKFREHSISMNINTMYDDLDTPGIINIEPYIDLETELLKVTATSERKPTMLSYMAELYDWTDANGNGIVDFPQEQNRMTYVIGSNSLELRYRDPIGRVTDGLVVQVKGFGGGSGEPLEDWTIHLEFFKKVDWSWLTLVNAPSTIAKGSSATFNMNLSVPAYADVGSYEGAVYINEKVPEETIATGVGVMKNNITFGFWAHYLGGSEAVILDDDLRSGERLVVPKSSIINWNGTNFFEGIDYTISGYAVTFVKEFPAGEEIPHGSAYFNITCLTVIAKDGNPVESAAWTGNMNHSNVVTGSYVLKKNGVLWDETETIIGENVVTAAGGEKVASLDYRNIVRGTTEFLLNGAEWAQDGGEVTEWFNTSTGSDTLQLSNVNIQPGSVKVNLNGNVLPQTGEVKISEKEEVDGLNSTAIPGSVIFNPNLAVNVSGSVWMNGTGVWFAKFPINPSIANDTLSLVSYILSNGTKDLTPGLHFDMMVDEETNKAIGTVQFKIDIDPWNTTYSAKYSYYNNSLWTGQLSHGLIISESYTVYLNGAPIKSGADYELNETSGEINLKKPLEPNQIVEAAYKFNNYTVNLGTGKVVLFRQLNINDNLGVTYRFSNYTLDMVTGLIRFAVPLQAGDVILANYTYARYTLDMMKGIVKFSSALLSGETVTCEYYFHSNVIPVFFSIGAKGPDFNFGGPDTISPELARNAYDDLFRYNEIRGGYGGEGDWRFVYMDVMEQGRYALPTDNERLLVNVKWEHDMTDVDVQVYGGREALPSAYTGWPYSALPSDRYGPHTIRHVGGSDVTSDFFTTTGGPEEITSPKISPGLNVIGLHTVGMNGAKTTEEFTANIGTMYIDQTEVNIVTNKLVGETQIRMNSNMEWSGVGGIAAGPSAPEVLKNQTITQDEDDWSLFDTFEDQLASGKTVYSRTIKDCLIFNVHIWGGAGVVDMDLGVFLDGSGEDEKKDGIVQADEFVAMCADGDADEEVKLIAPKDGTYLIVPFGFTLTTDPALFDMDITIVQGTGFDLSGKGINSLPAEQKGYFSSNQTEMPFNSTYLNLKWDLPGSATGTLQGALYVGPGNGPMCMLVPIILTLDTSAPLMFEPSPAPLSSINNRRPNIVVSVSDFERGELVPGTMKMVVDGQDVTSQTNVNIPFDDSDEATTKGYAVGTALYVPSMSLADGIHTVKATINDKAGNLAILEWVFTVDSTAPMFDITSPRESVSYTTSDKVVLKGYTEPSIVPRLVGATALETTYHIDGSFEMIVPLEIGENIFTIRFTDGAGNNVDALRTVVRDNTAPTFTSVRFSTGFMTNSPYTTLSGKMSEPGTMLVNSAGINVNSDGSYEKTISLVEGVNTIHLEFMDLAGNIVHSWQNVTLDTIAPTISLGSAPAKIGTQSLTLTGSVESNSELLINGKRISVGTRQSTSDFTTTLTLSEGQNIIVIEAKDSAGNVAELRYTVEYDANADVGTNFAAIGLMIALLVVGLILGMFLGPMILGGKKEDIPEEEQPTDDELPEEEKLDLEAESEDVSSDAEMPEEPLESEMPQEDVEPIPAEESIPEEFIPEEPLEPAQESEVLPDEPTEPAEPEDPRIVKLRDAYESGKISKELYEKNLAKFKGQ